jgi:hypothetical protein
MLSLYHEAQLTRIQKIEWISSYEKARNMSFTAKNIVSAWRGAGLIPIDRKKALRYLSTEKEMNSSTAETAPCTPTKQTFNTVFLTSSSPELGALHRANEALEEHIMVLRTPVRAFVRECTSRSEQTSARHAIIRHENAALHSILNKRREIKKGKRAVLKGKFRITSVELRDGVLAAEKETVDRQQKKGKSTDNNELQVLQTSLEAEDLAEDDGETEIQDCIVLAVE